ncbi:glycosyltransferase family 2 protein [Poriferisphaera sp. WC338]|uniref:glycosyltransferase family 2 protein n=1 Tax=Poriferisphaera sp. WC338 TaxID=3425129 RepID=UPI003D81A8B0
MAKQYQYGIVSIITACYNAEKYIADTINSVQNQTYHDWEMIIINDCSNDKSVEIIEKYIQEDERIILLHTDKNSGQSVTKNKGVEAATGQYLVYLDSDDLWDHIFLERMIHFMKEKDASLVTASYRRKTHDLSEDLGQFIVPIQMTYQSTLKSCALSCLTTMYDMSKIGKYYMPILKKRPDLALWLSIFKDIPCAYGLQEVLATYRIHGGSISRNKFSAASFQWRVYREIEKLSLLKASYYFIHYAVRGFFKNYELLKPKANLK